MLTKKGTETLVQAVEVGAAVTAAVVAAAAMAVAEALAAAPLAAAPAIALVKVWRKQRKRNIKRSRSIRNPIERRGRSLRSIIKKKLKRRPKVKL